MSGYNTPFIPGWDCHGLPVELQVEKKYGKGKFKDDPKGFISADMNPFGSSLNLPFPYFFSTCSSTGNP